MQELEAATADLSSQALADKRALLDLREELVREKMAGEQLTASLEQAKTRILAIQDTASQVATYLAQYYTDSVKRCVTLFFIKQSLEVHRRTIWCYCEFT